MVFKNVYENLGKGGDTTQVWISEMEMFPKVLLEKEEMMEVDLWKRALCVSVRHTNLTVRPHYPGMGRGLARSLDTLVWDTS